MAMFKLKQYISSLIVGFIPGQMDMIIVYTVKFLTDRKMFRVTCINHDFE